MRCAVILGVIKRFMWFIQNSRYRIMCDSAPLRVLDRQVKAADGVRYLWAIFIVFQWLLSSNASYTHCILSHTKGYLNIAISYIQVIAKLLFYENIFAKIKLNILYLQIILISECYWGFSAPNVSHAWVVIEFLQQTTHKCIQIISR